MNVPLEQAYGPNVMLVLLERPMARDLHVWGPEIARLALLRTRCIREGAPAFDSPHLPGYKGT